MIYIRNISKRRRNKGKHIYEIGIAGKTEVHAMTTFEHRREDSLSTCLRRAADAVDKYLEKELTNALRGLPSFTSAPEEG